MKNKFLKDFEAFTNPENEVSPPNKTSAKALEFVKEQMSPSHTIIMAKLVVLQIFVGLLTMIICPQFNLSIGDYYKFFHFLHNSLGAQACFALCGAIFMGPTAIVSAYILSESEIWKIQKNFFLHYALLSGLSVLAFTLIGSDIYLHLVHFWFLGALLFSILMFLTCVRVKKALA